MGKAVYLAGPEVFLPNARAILDLKIGLTREAGLVPVAPGDLTIPKMANKLAQGRAISAANEELMGRADAIIANLTPFRGIAADTGTVYELGFMCARGKAAFGYSNVSESHFERIKTYYRNAVTPDEKGQLRGQDGLSLEDFDMADNLMLDGGIALRGGAMISHSAKPDELYTDMTAFKALLALAARQLQS